MPIPQTLLGFPALKGLAADFGVPAEGTKEVSALEDIFMVHDCDTADVSTICCGELASRQHVGVQSSLPCNADNAALIAK